MGIPLSTSRENKVGFWLWALVAVVAVGVQVEQAVQAWVGQRECWACTMTKEGAALETVFTTKGMCERFRQTMQVQGIAAGACVKVPCVLKDDGDTDNEEES